MWGRAVIFLLIFLSLAQANAQTSFVLGGNIRDRATGEDLPAAAVIVENRPNTGTVSNSYGFYSLTLPAGEYRITFRYMGYETAVHTVSLYKNQILDVSLGESAYTLGSVVVTGERADRNVTSLDMGSVQMTPRQVETIPVIFGEPDILKTIQLTPGVKPAGEGNSGFYVRGGGIDQNLILLDEAPVYSPSHLLGFFSVFNSEALRNTNLMKGFIPAEYGGRASSVLDIQMKEGNFKNLALAGNVGLISSNMTVEGPIVKDKSSFMLSGRRTYADLFLNFSSDDDIRNTYLYFYDINLKTNYRINERNRIFLSGYLGRDDFGYKDEFGFDWGSITGTLRWNHIFSNRLFSNTSIILSHYSYDISIMRSFDAVIRSEIRDLNLKQDFSFYLNPENTLKFGFNVIHHQILPGEAKVDEGFGTFITSQDISRRNGLEGAIYISNQQRIAPRVNLYYGLRYTWFSNIGPGEHFEFDSYGVLRETSDVEKGKIFYTQGGFEPRLAVNYNIDGQSSFKASYTRLHQYLHLITNTTTTTPTDLWLPSSNNVKPQIAEQYSAGYFRNLKDNAYEASVELYYKDLQNQIDYKNGADLFFNRTVETELVHGKGWAYGAEFMLRKSTGKLSGWLGYTWSRTMRQFSEINNGEPFPARHDRTHDVSAVAMYDLGRKLKLSATWVYYTGDAVTFPSGRYEVDGKIIAYYTERNGYRMPDYHRMDIGLVWLRRKTDKFESSWNFSVYNAYARENAYFIDFRPKEDNPSETEAVQVSLFKAIPSISYKFKF